MYDTSSFFVLPNWTLPGDLDFCNQAGISTAILSLSSPGTSVLEDATAQAALARASNREAAAIRDLYPNHYGFFAAIPSMLYASQAIAEIDYALDELHADGVTVFTRYDGPNDTAHYLGSQALWPVWDHLDNRSAVVFTHPTYAPEVKPIERGFIQPAIDWTHETTKAAVDMIFTGMIGNHTNLKVILSHAGGTLPYIAERPALFLPLSPGSNGVTEQSFLEDARRFYYDTAVSGAKAPLAAMKTFVDPDHIIYGSDHPYAADEGILIMNSRLDEFEQGEELNQIKWGNALSLVPRLSKQYGQ